MREQQKQEQKQNFRTKIIERSSSSTSSPRSFKILEKNFFKNKNSTKSSSSTSSSSSSSTSRLIGVVSRRSRFYGTALASKMASTNTTAPVQGWPNTKDDYELKEVIG